MGDSKLAKWFIGAELYALRELAGITQGELGRRLGVNYQTIASWEQGKRVPLRSVVKDVCEMARIEESRKEFLLFVVDNYKQAELVANLHTRNVRMVEQGERSSGYIFKFEPEYVPGPLQLSGYHTELLPNADPESLKRKLERGRVLRSRTDVEFEALIGYNALRHLRGMVHWERQIEALLEASERPNWEIRVIDGLHRGSRGSFELYKPGDSPSAGPAFVYAESLDKSRYVEDGISLRWYDRLRTDIWDLGKPIKEIFSGGIQLLA